MPKDAVASTRYRIDSADDAGLSGISFVLHGNSSVHDSAEILKNGLVVQEGRATVSSDLSHAVRWATTAEKRQFSRSTTVRADNEVGSIFIIKVPEALRLGYGVHTSIFVDDVHKKITGAPRKYASGRKQLAFYSGQNTEAIRQNIELSKQANAISVSPKAIVAVIRPTNELCAAITALQEQVRQFKVPQTTELLRRLREAVNGEVSDDIIAQLIEQTITSIAISRVRNVYLDVKRAQGYKVFLEDKSLDTKKVLLENVVRRVREVNEVVFAPGFSLGPKWLTAYLQAQAEAMRQAVS